MQNYLEIAKTIYPQNNNYHSYKHVEDLLRWFNLYKESFHSEGMSCTDNQMSMAIVYHDAVYIPGSTTNEYDSVQFMNRCGINDPTIESLIMSTVVDNHHMDNWKNYSIDQKIMHDLDWFGFTFSTGIFSQTMSIISEVEFYCRNKFSREEILKNRMKFLESLFDKDLYFTKTLADFNTLAKENIKKHYDLCKTLLGENK